MTTTTTTRAIQAISARIGAGCQDLRVYKRLTRILREACQAPNVAGFRNSPRKMRREARKYR